MWQITFPGQDNNALSSPHHFHVGPNEEINRIRNIIIKATGRPPFLALNQPPTLEASTLPTENKCFYKTFTELDSLTSYLLRNIDMWHAGLLHCNKLKPVLLRITQHHLSFFWSGLRGSKAYSLWGGVIPSPSIGYDYL